MNDDEKKRAVFETYQKGGGDSNLVVLPGMPQRVLVSLTATGFKGVNSSGLFQSFSQTALDVSHIAESVIVSMYPDYDSDEEEEVREEYHDELTMHKVRHAILSVGLSEATVADVINALENAGILFRENR